jgi:hypothetical protein
MKMLLLKFMYVGLLLFCSTWLWKQNEVKWLLPNKNPAHSPDAPATAAISPAQLADELSRKKNLPLIGVSGKPDMERSLTISEFNDWITALYARDISFESIRIQPGKSNGTITVDAIGFNKNE